MKIAIKANPDRGKEIISLLESLGSTKNTLSGDGKLYTYYIDDNNVIRYGDAPKNYKVYTLEEFEQEFPFKIGDKVTIAGLPDFPKVITQMAWDCDEILYSFEDSNNAWFSANALKKFEMKEKRNITLTLDKAKEWYRKGGELKEIALQAFTEEELTKIDLPKTWKEFCDNYPVQKGECYLCVRDNISKSFHSCDREHKNWIPSQKSAEAHLAMIQLEQLRDCWRQGWKPTEYNTGYHIVHYPKKYLISVFGFIGFLTFPTEEMAEEFLKCFRDLIEKAGDLI